MERNVLGDPLMTCSDNPKTGYGRDGYCREVEGDVGCHHLCAVVTEGFLRFSKKRGNDLVTPQPAFDFPGLEPGDRWCLCVGRWVEAHEEGCAPPVLLEATNESVLNDLPLEVLREYAADEPAEGSEASAGGSSNGDFD